MDQEKIGKFIAALRREKNLTQEELAERLGVNNRSISRWENGHCMPDLSLLQSLSEELDAGIEEILNGGRLDGEETIGRRDSISLAAEWSNREKQKKARQLNVYFTAGLVCLAAVIFHGWSHILDFPASGWDGDAAAGVLAGLGFLLELAGLYHNSHDKFSLQEEIELSLRKRKLHMKKTREMLQYARRYQEADLRSYEAAFKEIEKNLTPEETVSFAATGTGYMLNELPMMWHVALAVTGDRLLIGGERMKGMLMVSHAVQSFRRQDILSVSILDSSLSPTIMIRTRKDELKIEMGNLEAARMVVREWEQLAGRN